MHFALGTALLDLNKKSFQIFVVQDEYFCSQFSNN